MHFIKKVSQIEIPGSVEKIGKEAFAKALSDVKLESGLKHIEGRHFIESQNLTILLFQKRENNPVRSICWRRSEKYYLENG